MRSEEAPEAGGLKTCCSSELYEEELVSSGMQLSPDTAERVAVP